MNPRQMTDKELAREIKQLADRAQKLYAEVVRRAVKAKSRV